MQIAVVLKKYGYTIESVADTLGIKAGSLRARLASKEGKQASPPLSLLRDIAGVAGCQVGEFFDDERTDLQKDWNGLQPKIDIARVLQIQNVTREEFATRLGVSIQQVYTFMAKQNLTTQTLYKIARALNVPITELFSY